MCFDTLTEIWHIYREFIELGIRVAKSALFHATGQLLNCCRDVFCSCVIGGKILLVLSHFLKRNCV